MANNVTTDPIDNGDLLRSVVIDDLPPEPVVPGITRRRLPSSGQVLMRVFDLEPGIVWPEVDVHDRDELIYVVDGVLVEGDRHYPAGSFLHYRAGSRHQPSTEVGVRILVSGPATA